MFSFLRDDLSSSVMKEPKTINRSFSFWGLISSHFSFSLLFRNNSADGVAPESQWPPIQLFDCSLVDRLMAGRG